MSSLIASISTPIIAVVVSLCVTWFWNYFISSEWRFFNIRVNNKINKCSKKFVLENKEVKLNKYINFFNETIQYLLAENKNKIIGNKLSKKLILDSIDNNYTNLINLSNFINSNNYNIIEINSNVFLKTVKQRDDDLTKIVEKKFGSIKSKLELIDEFIKINVHIDEIDFELSFCKLFEFDSLA